LLAFDRIFNGISASLGCLRANTGKQENVLKRSAGCFIEGLRLENKSECKPGRAPAGI